jgi:hypothetical protein
MWQTFKFAILSASLLLTAFAVLAVLGFFSNLGLHGSIAAALGIALTTIVAILLMGLMFFSDRSHYDKDPHNVGRKD